MGKIPVELTRQGLFQSILAVVQSFFNVIASIVSGVFSLFWGVLESLANFLGASVHFVACECNAGKGSVLQLINQQTFSYWAFLPSHSSFTEIETLEELWGTTSRRRLSRVAGSTPCALIERFSMTSSRCGGSREIVSVCTLNPDV